MTEMKTSRIDLEEIERKAREMRAEYTTQMLKAAGAWIVSKFSSALPASSKTA
ncbi:RSP_7527 family protein [Litoreibacter arenae]|uniref:Uncharacterized protein n=1 Tax=Litoreibacter arenae DSM 19593 TaxID=1123360 RepID=S9S534_9RHOB|nr:hypothetical protein [Litoreibacter arenae]EPX81294.1 hypothetical protein thalar_00744 [Litoreibacter arenae DSM 19593]